MYIFQYFFYNYMVFGFVAIIFKCAFLRGIECSLLRKNISNFAEATREKRFTTMTSLGMSRATDYDVINASQIASNSS